jgi:hypothetical protein
MRWQMFINVEVQDNAFDCKQLGTSALRLELLASVKAGAPPANFDCVSRHSRSKDAGRLRASTVKHRKRLNADFVRALFE